MSILIAEGWKNYADRNELIFGYPLTASTTSSTVFADVSRRRTLDLCGAKMAKAFPPNRRVCCHFIVDLTAGSISSNTLFSVGLNPANSASYSYAGINTDRFLVEANGPNIKVSRQPFSADGSAVTGTQTVATAAHGFSAGSSYRVEFVVDVSGETGTMVVMVNGTTIIDADFSRAFGGNTNDAPFGIFSLYSQNSANSRGRISNFVLYSDDTATAWPTGPLNISYLPAQPNSGETISFPPVASDPEIPITDATGKTWDLQDLTGVSATAIKGVMGLYRVSAPDAVTPANANVSWKNGSNVLASATQQIQPGAPVYDRQIAIPVTDPAVLNAMTMTAKQA